MYLTELKSKSKTLWKRKQNTRKLMFTARAIYKRAHTENDRKINNLISLRCRIAIKRSKNNTRRIAAIDKECAELKKDTGLKKQRLKSATSAFERACLDFKSNIKEIDTARDISKANRQNSLSYFGAPYYQDAERPKSYC